MQRASCFDMVDQNIHTQRCIYVRQGEKQWRVSRLLEEKPCFVPWPWLQERQIYFCLFWTRWECFVTLHDLLPLTFLLMHMRGRKQPGKLEINGACRPCPRLFGKERGIQAARFFSPSTKHVGWFLTASAAKEFLPHDFVFPGWGF